MGIVRSAGRGLWFLIVLVAGVVLLGLGAVALRDNVGVALLLWLAGVVLLWRGVLRPARGKAKAETVPATILRVWEQPPPGAPWYHWTYVLFESRGRRIQIHLTKSQAKTFATKYSVGDTGRLTYSGDRMVDWELPTPERPLADARHVSVFVSYSHAWSEDAEYVTQFFQARGMKVWVDKEQLRVGDRLRSEVVQAIEQSDYFVPLLSPEYWTSEWCIREFEAAARSRPRILPLKVSTGALTLPPHIRELYRETLEEPLFLDLRGRNPVGQLSELAEQMVTSRD